MIAKNDSWSIIFVYIILLVIISACQIVHPAAVASAQEFEEKLIFFGKQDEKTKVFPDSLAISPDGKHMAYVAKNDKGMFVRLDGKPDSKIWVKIGRGTPKFNITSDRMAYTAYDGKHWHVVINGTVGPGFDGLTRLAFSPDGKHFAYVVNYMKDAMIVINNKKGPRYDHVEEIKFSPDSRNFIFNVYDNGGWYLVDKKLRKSSPYALVRTLKFSPNSKNIAYVAKRGKEVFVVLNGKELPHKGKYIGMTEFSPDSKHFAFGIFGQDDKWRVVVDGVSGPPLDLAVQFAFSSNSQRWAYSGRMDGKEVLYVDGKIVANSDKIDSIKFSSDSEHIIHRASENGKWFVAIDGKKQKEYENVIGLGLAPNNEIFYVGKLENEKRVLVRGSKQGKAYDGIGKLTLSSKGNRWAVPVEVGDDKFMLIDDNLFGPYSEIRHVGFSYDEKHIAFTARKEARWFMVVDGISLKERFNVLPIGLLVYFSSSNEIHLPISNYEGENPSFYRYEVKIKE